MRAVLIIMLFFYGPCFSQDIIYDSVNKQLLFFDCNDNYVGYIKKTFLKTAAYNKKDKEIPVTELYLYYFAPCPKIKRTERMK